MTSPQTPLLSAQRTEPGSIVVSLSGGKDSIASLLALVATYGPDRIVAHHQVLPEDWDETVPYNQGICARLGVRLVCQQVVYEPVGDGVGVRRLRIQDIQSPTDITPWGTGAIAGVTDLAVRRGWPPSAAVRMCTSYFKRDLLNAWLAQHRAALGSIITVALGERRAESPRRARKPAEVVRIAYRAQTVFNWLPNADWSRRQVFRWLADWGIRPHPAYARQGLTRHAMLDLDEEGGPRTSCRFCIFATQSDVCHQAQAESHRPLLDRLATVETLTGRTWWPNRSAQAVLAAASAGGTRADQPGNVAGPESWAAATEPRREVAS